MMIVKSTMICMNGNDLEDDVCSTSADFKLTLMVSSDFTVWYFCRSLSLSLFSLRKPSNQIIIIWVSFFGASNSGRLLICLKIGRETSIIFKVSARTKTTTTATTTMAPATTTRPPMLSLLARQANISTLILVAFII